MERDGSAEGGFLLADDEDEEEEHDGPSKFNSQQSQRPSNVDTDHSLRRGSIDLEAALRTPPIKRDGGSPSPPPRASRLRSVSSMSSASDASPKAFPVALSESASSGSSSMTIRPSAPPSFSEDPSEVGENRVNFELERRRSEGGGQEGIACNGAEKVWEIEDEHGWGAEDAWSDEGAVDDSKLKKDKGD